MSAAAALVCVSPPRPATIINSRPSSPTPHCRRASSSSSSSSITNNFFFISSRSCLHGISGGTYTLWPSYLSRRRFHLGITRRFSSPVMEWQDCTVKMDIDVPISVAYKCYSDREAIPHWMPFISSVKILENKPDTSQWSLKYTAFGRDIEFSWLARNMQPIPNQKIHWRSLEGLPNRGAARFFPRGASSCIVELTVSYEVPQLLVPVASALKPFLENLLTQGLERFAKFAKNYAADSSTRSKQGD